MFVDAADAVRYPAGRSLIRVPTAVMRAAPAVSTSATRPPTSVTPTGRRTRIHPQGGTLAGLKIGARAPRRGSRIRTRGRPGSRVRQLLHGITDKAARYQHCLDEPAEQRGASDAGDTERTRVTFDMPGQIPQHPVRVVFQDDNYDAAEGRRPTTRTWSPGTGTTSRSSPVTGRRPLPPRRPRTAHDCCGHHRPQPSRRRPRAHHRSAHDAAPTTAAPTTAAPTTAAPTTAAPDHRTPTTAAPRPPRPPPHATTVAPTTAPTTAAPTTAAPRPTTAAHHDRRRPPQRPRPQRHHRPPTTAAPTTAAPTTAAPTTTAPTTAAPTTAAPTTAAPQPRHRPLHRHHRGRRWRSGSDSPAARARGSSEHRHHRGPGADDHRT